MWKSPPQRPSSFILAKIRPHPHNVNPLSCLFSCFVYWLLNDGAHPSTCQQGPCFSYYWMCSAHQCWAQSRCSISNTLSNLLNKQIHLFFLAKSVQSSDKYSHSFRVALFLAPWCLNFEEHRSFLTGSDMLSRGSLLPEHSRGVWGNFYYTWGPT